MWKYVKKLQYPVNIKKRDPKLAKYILTQYGGPSGKRDLLLGCEFYKKVN